MNAIVVYASRYGSTKSYAEEFAQRHNLEVVSHDAPVTVTSYDTIYYFAYLLAGNPNGLKSFAKKLTNTQNLYVITVGLSDDADPSTADYNRKNVKSVLPDFFKEKTPIYHLRGAVKYKELTALHRFMMYFVYLKAKNDDNDDAKEIVNTYGDVLSLINFDDLDQIPFEQMDA